MSAARKKKVEDRTLYNSFYGKWPDEYEKDVNEAMKSVEKQMQDYALRLKASLKENKAKPQPPQRDDLENLRDTIRKGAKGNSQSTAYGLGAPNPFSNDPLERSSIDMYKSQTNTPIISDVVRVKDLKDFSNETHSVKLALPSTNYYSEEITTKIVGMESVDWWEYVLLYGFVKSLKLGYEYTKVKEFIDKGIKSTRTVKGQNLKITLVPKKNDVKQNFDTVGGQKVIRETGTVYETINILLDVPQKEKIETQEYRRGYFVYENSFTTLVIDYDALNEQIEKMLIDRNINQTLIDEIKNVLKNGRLSTI